MTDKPSQGLLVEAVDMADIDAMISFLFPQRTSNTEHKGPQGHFVLHRQSEPLVDTSAKEVVSTHPDPASISLVPSSCPLSHTTPKTATDCTEPAMCSQSVSAPTACLTPADK